MKFGGTSLGSALAVQQAVEIVRAARAGQAHPPAVVASAVAGVTDLLQEGARSAAASEHRTRSIAEQLRQVHARCAEAVAGPERESLNAEIDSLVQDYARFCGSLAELGGADPRALDRAMSFGERMSVRLLAAALRHDGIPAAAFDATDLIVTDRRHLDAAPDLPATRARVQAAIPPRLDAGEVPVITGFIGATPEGVTTTLGRGGSDLSAGVIAACLDSDELWIWTDVDGVMTADPRVVPAAHTIERLSYDEVRELSYFGAKVLHPRTIQPVQEAGIPVRVKNTFRPDHPGTLILPSLQPGIGAIKAITAVPDVSLITVAGTGMLGVPGIAGRTFEAVARTGASVLLISQSSSEQSICFAVRSADACSAVAAIEQEFEQALLRHDIDQVWAQDDITIVTVVGWGMRETPGIAGRVFSATGSQGINVIAIAQGSSECSISLVVREVDGKAAVRAIHELVIEGPLAGPGKEEIDGR